MWCVYKGHIAIMVQDTRKRNKNGLRCVYIGEKQWFAMTDEQRQRYIA